VKDVVVRAGRDTAPKYSQPFVARFQLVVRTNVPSFLLPVRDTAEGCVIHRKQQKSDRKKQTIVCGCGQKVGEFLPTDFYKCVVVVVVTNCVGDDPSCSSLLSSAIYT
jgi:hypothetical protein